MILGHKNRESRIYKINWFVARDIQVLAELTGFTADEIVNKALKEVLLDNKNEFLRLAVYEHFMSEFENAEDGLEPFELGNVRVEVNEGDEGADVRGIVKDDHGNVLEDYTKHFDNSCSNEFDEWLKDLGAYIDSESDDVKEYLKNRTDHREIFYK